MLLWRQLSATLLAAGVKAVAGRGQPGIPEAPPAALAAETAKSAPPRQPAK